MELVCFSTICCPVIHINPNFLPIYCVDILCIIGNPFVLFCPVVPRFEAICLPFSSVNIIYYYHYTSHSLIFNCFSWFWNLICLTWYWLHDRYLSSRFQKNFFLAFVRLGCLIYFIRTMIFLSGRLIFFQLFLLFISKLFLLPIGCFLFFIRDYFFHFG